MQNKKKGRLPNFIIIGAARSGSTSLHYALDTHPQVFMSPIKETNYFLFYGNSEPTSSISLGRREKITRGSATTIENYHACFDSATSSHTAIGETSPAYLYTPEVPGRIKESIPDTKIMAILRHPVESAYSRYLYNLSRESNKNPEDFSKIIDLNCEQVKKAGTGTSYLDGNYHYRNLKRYYDIFNKNKIKILFFENLQKKDFFQPIFDFLEVDSNHKPDTSSKYNQSGFSRDSLLYRSIIAVKPLKKVILKHIPQAQGLIKSAGRQYQKLGSKSTSTKPLTKDQRSDITKRYFLEDIKKLEDLIEQDLTRWIE